MTNKEIQEKLDLERYYESEKHEGDMSGLMGYCYYCKHQKNGCNCFVPYAERTEKAICSMAYNRMNKAKR